MGKGAVHPTFSNFSRWRKLNIVGRMRHLIDSGVLRRPTWMTAVERNPPLELHSLHLNSRTVSNPFPALVRNIAREYPDMRFQDCFVDGNEWAKGVDNYRNDHPIMQFAVHQLQFMRDGLSQSNAFRLTKKLFYERRINLEREQKIHMALGLCSNVMPMFSSGQAYVLNELAARQLTNYRKIREEMRKSNNARVLTKLRDAWKISGDSNQAIREYRSFKENTKVSSHMKAPSLAVSRFLENLKSVKREAHGQSNTLCSRIWNFDDPVADGKNVQRQKKYKDKLSKPGEAAAAKGSSSVEDNKTNQDISLDALLQKVSSCVTRNDFGEDLTAVADLVGSKLGTKIATWSEVGKKKCVFPNSAEDEFTSAFVHPPDQEFEERVAAPLAENEEDSFDNVASYFIKLRSANHPGPSDYSGATSDNAARGTSLTARDRSRRKVSGRNSVEWEDLSNAEVVVRAATNSVTGTSPTLGAPSSVLQRQSSDRRRCSPVPAVKIVQRFLSSVSFRRDLASLLKAFDASTALQLFRVHVAARIRAGVIYVLDNLVSEGSTNRNSGRETLFPMTHGCLPFAAATSHALSTRWAADADDQGFVDISKDVISCCEDIVARHSSFASEVEV